MDFTAKISDKMQEAGRMADIYRALWRQRYGQACSSSAVPRRAVAAMARLIAEVGYTAALERLRCFMRDGGEWLVARGHPIMVFVTTSDRYAGGQREARNGTQAGFCRRAGFGRYVVEWYSGRRPGEG